MNGISGLSNKMDLQGRELTDKINLSNLNLRKAIEENAIEFKQDNDDIEKQMEETEENMDTKIDLAISQNNANWENRNQTSI